MIEDYLRMLHDWPLGTLVGGVIALIGLLLICGLIYWIVKLIDTVGRPVRSTVGVITDRDSTPAHTTVTLIYNDATKTQTPIFNHIPASYDVTVQLLDGLERTLSVSHETYNQAHKGDRVTVFYVIGRMTGHIHALDYEPASK